jgi:hypothetical protein
MVYFVLSGAVASSGNVTVNPPAGEVPGVTTTPVVAADVARPGVAWSVPGAGIE